MCVVAMLCSAVPRSARAVPFAPVPYRLVPRRAVNSCAELVDPTNLHVLVDYEAWRLDRLGAVEDLRLRPGVGESSLHGLV